jgi:predicted transcriptional regulator
MVKEEKVKKSASRELIQNVFGGNVGGLVSYLLENERLSGDELTEIRKLIDQKQKSGK